jgi:hypothetical protein
MLWQVLFRYTNPSKCRGKSCSDTQIRPNVVASPVQIHQSVQMLWHVLFRYTNSSKCCGMSCSDAPIRPSVVAHPVQMHKFVPNVVAHPVQMHQFVQMLWQVLFRYTKPSKRCDMSSLFKWSCLRTSEFVSHQFIQSSTENRTLTQSNLNGRTFPRHCKQYKAYSYRKWQQVTKVTFSHSHTCLTPGEQIIKYCLKFLPINCPYYTSSLMKAARLSPPVIGVYMKYYVITVTQSGLNCWAQHMYLSFVSILQYNREDLQSRNPHNGRNRIKSVVENLEYGCPVVQFRRNQLCVRAERSHFQHV